MTKAVVRPIVRSVARPIVRGAAGGEAPEPEEFITNGGFDSADGWTLGANWAIAGGSATVTSGTQFISRPLIAPLVAGDEYVLSFDHTSASGGSFFALVTDGVSPNNWTGVTTGTVFFRFTANAAHTSVSFRRISGTSHTIDNASIKPSLIANGGMDSDAGWTLGAGWSIGAGVAEQAGGTEALSRPLLEALTPSNFYILSFDLVNDNSGEVRVLAGSQIVFAGATAGVSLGGTFQADGAHAAVSVISHDGEPIAVDNVALTRA